MAAFLALFGAAVAAAGGSHSPARGSRPELAPASSRAQAVSWGPELIQQVDQAQPAEAATGNPRNLLATPDGLLQASVGVYSDCRGFAPLSHAVAAIDTCISGLTGVPYFVGHNPGVFTPLVTLAVGSTIDYFDGTGREHALRVIAARTWLRRSGLPPPVQAGEAAQFQTCLTADGSVDRILDAVEV